MVHVLILAETDGERVLPGTQAAITFAQQLVQVLNTNYSILLVGGPGIEEQAPAWSGYGAERILLAADSALTHPTADRVAEVCAQAAKQIGATFLTGLSSSFGRDVLPRVAGLLDLPMVTDVLAVEQSVGGLAFRRPIYAGNILATVRIEGDGGVFSVRGTAFGSPSGAPTSSPIETLQIETAALPTGTTWVSQDTPEQRRPELTSARVVVSGGRPLRDAETFERLLGGLADKLGGAVGATRAAVDSGIAPNELQIGQTGKVVAPDLYIAAGISGSVQHLAGMKDSKVIVAINTDPEAPIFEVADYGLVADLHQAIPEMISKL